MSNNNLLAIRLEKGKTMRQVAQAANCTAAVISDIENKGRQPGILRAYRIANALNVSVFRIWPNVK